MRLLILILIAIVAPLTVTAQQFELGATVGGGIFGADGTGQPTYVIFGAETCAFCRSSAAVFAEFSHWQRSTAGYRTSIRCVELLAVGARIQGGRRVRPFFDVGFAAGWDRFTRLGDGRDDIHGNPGLLLGGGAAVSIGEHWYIRPQARIVVLRGIHAGVAALVGIGYRFR